MAKDYSYMVEYKPGFLSAWRNYGAYYCKAWAVMAADGLRKEKPTAYIRVSSYRHSKPDEAPKEARVVYKLDGIDDYG